MSPAGGIASGRAGSRRTAPVRLPVAAAGGGSGLRGMAGTRATLLLAATAACAGDSTPGASSRSGGVAGPPAGADVWLAELAPSAAGPLLVGPPENVTDRPGYDNQPYFLPDGSGFWYTSADESGQADIWRYGIDTRRRVRVTRTAPESEYSATPLPDGTGFSVVRVEADSTQRLWRFDARGTGGRVLLPDVAPVGYHAWAGERSIALFVLGDPPTLQVADVDGGPPRVVDRNVGRSLQSIPGSWDVSYVRRRDDGFTEIRRLRPASGTTEPIVESAARGGDFHAWTPDGVLLQADGARLMARRPEEAGWTVVADFTSRGLVVSRLAVSPDGTWLALVAEPAGG